MSKRPLGIFLWDRKRWASFLLGWQPKGTVAVPFTKTKSERVNVAVVATLWDCVHFMVTVARKVETTPQERVQFAECSRRSPPLPSSEPPWQCLHRACRKPYVASNCRDHVFFVRV